MALYYNNDISEQLCSALDPYLQEVNKKYIKLNEEDTKICVKATLEVVNYVIDSLKKMNSKFSVFNELIYCGSYYDGLRVKEATEFDMNLVIETSPLFTGWPIRMDIVDGERITIKRACSASDSRYVNSEGVMEDCMDRNTGYVRADGMNSWLQSIVDTRFNSSSYQHFKDYRFRFRTNPPARTLEIYTGYKNIEIDVDLAPAIRFHNRIPKLKDILTHHDILVVPKLYDGNIYWRAAFPEQEKELLTDCGNLLYIGRLLKGLRETLNLNLKSYYIKTLLLYEAERIKRTRSHRLFWQKSPGYLFIYMLKKLEETLERKSLRGFWLNEERFTRNQYSDEELTNMYNRVKNVRETLIYTLKNLGQHDLRKLINQLFSD